MRGPVARAPPPSVAVLYSGRWYSEIGQEWVNNHLENLIRPYDASVFVVANLENVCHSSNESSALLRAGKDGELEALFNADVRAAFHGWDKVYTLLATSLDSYPGLDLFYKNAERTLREAGRAAGINLKPDYLLAMLGNWYKQFRNFRRAEDLRRANGPHDFVVRARLDVIFSGPVDLRKAMAQPRSQPAVYALDYDGLMIDQFPLTVPCDSEAAKEPKYAQVRCRRFWRDWMYVGRPEHLIALAEMIPPKHIYTNLTERCLGMCPEEQTALQLRASHVEMKQLNTTNATWQASLKRLTHMQSHHMAALVTHTRPCALNRVTARG